MTYKVSKCSICDKPVTGYKFARNSDELRQIKRDYKLTSKDVAKLLYCEEVTVISWLRNPESESSRNMPDGKLKHLKLALRGRKKVKLC